MFGVFDVVFFGDIIVYLCGDMNGWLMDDVFIYQGDGKYIVIVIFEGGVIYGFKFVFEDWSIVNFGVVDGEEGIVIVGEEKVFVCININFLFILVMSVIYLFIIDVIDSEVLIFMIENEEFYVGILVYFCGVMNDWGMVEEFVY